MKALLVGGFNSLTNALAVKLIKNGFGVAVLNEEKNRKHLHPRCAKYTSDTGHIGKVYANYRPDIVLVTSFYDEACSINDLANILSQGVFHGIRRIIFFSSTLVYGIQPEEWYLPAETDAASPAGKRGIEFSVAEELCRQWEGLSAIQVTVLRLAMLYGPGADDQALNIWIDQLLDGQTVELPVSARYSCLHMDDMAEAALQVVNAGFSPVYNVVSGETLTASELAENLTRCTGLTAAPLELKIGEDALCLAADNRLLRKEYNWSERHSLSSEMPEVVCSVQNRREKAQKKALRTTRRQRRVHGDQLHPVATAETLLLFALTVFLTLIQDTIPLIDNINFIALYLILIAVSMNLQQSALSLILTCVFLVYQQVQKGYDVFTAIITAQTLLKAAEYCVIGISVSYVFHRLRTRMLFLQMEKADLQNELRVVEQFSEDNLRTRHFFEDQILKYEVSLPRVISMTARLDVMETERIIPETIRVLAESVGAEDVAAYVIGSRGGRMRLSHAATRAARAMGRSPVLDDCKPLLSALENDQVFINRAMDPAYPSIASGVKTDGKLAFVFVMWNIPYRKMCLDTSNLLQTITHMVSAALQRAFRYEEMSRDERYLPGTGILRFDAFHNLCEARGVEKADSGDILCSIQAAGTDLIQLGEQVEPLVRENDYMGDGADGSLLLLLSGTSMEGCQSFQNRLARHGLSCEVREALPI